MFQFQESQILSPSINGRQELVFRVKIKREDYTLEDFGKMAIMFDDTAFSMVMVPFQTAKVEDKLPKLRQQLALVMQEYCEVSGDIMGDLISVMHQKYKVKSRTELTEEQLRDQIESFRYGIREYTN